MAFLKVIFWYSHQISVNIHSSSFSSVIVYANIMHCTRVAAFHKLFTTSFVSLKQVISYDVGIVPWDGETWIVGASFLGNHVKVPLGIVTFINDRHLFFPFTFVDNVAFSIHKNLGAAILRACIKNWSGVWAVQLGTLKEFEQLGLLVCWSILRCHFLSSHGVVPRSAQPGAVADTLYENRK